MRTNSGSPQTQEVRCSDAARSVGPSRITVKDAYLNGWRDVSLVLRRARCVDGDVRLRMALLEKKFHALFRKMFAFLDGLVFVVLECFLDQTRFFNPQFAVDDPVASVAQLCAIQAGHALCMCDARLPCAAARRVHRCCRAHSRTFKGNDHPEMFEPDSR